MTEAGVGCEIESRDPTSYPSFRQPHFLFIYFGKSEYNLGKYFTFCLSSDLFVSCRKYTSTHRSKEKIIQLN